MTHCRCHAPLGSIRAAPRRNPPHCAGAQGGKPRVFGSVATGTDDDESDLDLLIDPVEGMSLFNLGGMSYRLEELLGIKVDITLAPNVYPRYRDRIFAEAKPV